LIADLTRVGYLPRVWLAPAPIRDLRQLVNHRQRLVNEKRSLKLQVGAILREQRVKIDKAHGARWSKRWIGKLREHVEVVEVEGLSEHARWIVNELMSDIAATEIKLAKADARLEQATQDDPVIAKLRQQPGVGPVTAWVLRACIGDFNRFKTAKQLSRYCGMSPCNASSGNKTSDAGLIDGCNKLLRMTLVQAAHRLIRTTKRWQKLAWNLRERGKPANVIVAAVGNRWVRTLHHAMKASTQAIATEGVSA
jgi:transposase